MQQKGRSARSFAGAESLARSSILDVRAMQAMKDREHARQTSVSASGTTESATLRSVCNALSVLVDARKV